MGEEQPESDKLGYGQPTTADLRAAIRERIGSQADGTQALRQHECLAARAELTDDALDSDVSVGEARYRLIEETDAENRDPFASANPFTRDELLAIQEVLDNEQ